MNRSIDIIVPIYKNADLVDACVRSLIANLVEFRDLSPRIRLINDSPEDWKSQACLLGMRPG